MCNGSYEETPETEWQISLFEGNKYCDVAFD